MYLGIDIGTGSVKAVLIGDDNLVGYAAGYPEGREGQYEQNPADLEDTLVRLFQDLHQNSGIDGGAIEGIAICGHGPSILFIDSADEPLTNIITWQDRRAEEEARYLQDKLSNFTKDGSSYEAKVLWFYNTAPELFEPGTTGFYPKDYILFRLCGNRIIDRSTASTIRFYDSDTNSWKFPDKNIPVGIFPEVHEPWEQIGVTGTDFSRVCGFSDGIPLYGGGIDAYGEALGAGAVDPGQLVEGTGTSTCISLCCSRNEGKDIHVIPDRSLNIEMMSFSGGSVAWGLNLFSESAAYLDTINPDVPIDILFLPYLIGERSPVWDENARGAFVGLSDTTDRKHLLQAILQGVGFGLKQCLDLLSQESAKEGNTIRAVGGGAQNRKWLKMKANITGKVYEQMKIGDSTALGSAILAAYAGGHGSLSEIAEKWAVVGESIPPNASASERYEELFHIYSHLYQNLKESFNQLSSFKTAENEKGEFDNAAV